MNDVDKIMKDKFGVADRFDFEEQLTRCWCIVDELKDLDEGLFEGWLDFSKDKVSTHILGIAEAYDVKFHKLWHLFETVFMNMVRENKMLNEECAALREQLGHGAGKNFDSGAGTGGFGIAAIKPNKKDKK